MQIHDPKKFGYHLRTLRQQSGMPIPLLIKMISAKSDGEIDLHPKLWAAVEDGMGGFSIDDDLIDVLMDCLPGFSPASSPGVNAPGMTVRESGDASPGDPEVRRAMSEMGRAGDGVQAIPAEPMNGPPSQRVSPSAPAPRAPAHNPPAATPHPVQPDPSWGLPGHAQDTDREKSADRSAANRTPESPRPGVSSLSDWLKGS